MKIKLLKLFSFRIKASLNLHVLVRWYFNLICKVRSYVPVACDLKPCPRQSKRVRIYFNKETYVIKFKRTFQPGNLETVKIDYILTGGAIKVERKKQRRNTFKFSHLFETLYRICTYIYISCILCRFYRRVSCLLLLTFRNQYCLGIVYRCIKKKKKNTKNRNIRKTVVHEIQGRPFY